MKPFVFIFRQGNRVLSNEELKQRTDDARAWALSRLAEGRTHYDEIITGVVTLDQTPDAFVRLQTDKSQIKILVAPGK